MAFILTPVPRSLQPDAKTVQKGTKRQFYVGNVDALAKTVPNVGARRTKTNNSPTKKAPIINITNRRHVKTT